MEWHLAHCTAFKADRRPTGMEGSAIQEDVTTLEADGMAY